MSGGVGPTYNEISLPKEEEHEHKETNDPVVSKTTKVSDFPTTRRRSSFFSLQMMNALAIVIIMSATGMVCPEDFAFVVFSLVYMHFLSKVAFPPVHPTAEPTVFDRKNKLLRLYVSVGAIVGLFLPIAYIFEGVFEGDKEGIRAAIPHVFLLASQVFMEGLSFSGRFSTPIRVFVPVSYNSRRIFAITAWLRDEFSKADKEYGGSARRLYVGRVLAVANLAFWSFNLFGFLLPFYLPRAFKRYYTEYNKRKD